MSGYIVGHQERLAGGGCPVITSSRLQGGRGCPGGATAPLVRDPGSRTNASVGSFCRDLGVVLQHWRRMLAGRCDEGATTSRTFCYNSCNILSELVVRVVALCETIDGAVHCFLVWLSLRNGDISPWLWQTPWNIRLSVGAFLAFLVLFWQGRCFLQGRLSLGEVLVFRGGDCFLGGGGGLPGA
jgi:hypothetical protein